MLSDFLEAMISSHSSWANGMGPLKCVPVFLSVGANHRATPYLLSSQLHYLDNQVECKYYMNAHFPQNQFYLGNFPVLVGETLHSYR